MSKQFCLIKQSKYYWAYYSVEGAWPIKCLRFS